MPIRKLMYKYHRLGLDTMYKSATAGRKVINECLTLLSEAYEARSMAYFPRLLTEYKNDELLNIYSNATLKERKDAEKIITRIDPSLSAKWDELLSKPEEQQL